MTTTTTTNPQYNFLLWIKSSRTRRKYFHKPEHDFSPTMTLNPRSTRATNGHPGQGEGQHHNQTIMQENDEESPPNLLENRLSPKEIPTSDFLPCTSGKKSFRKLSPFPPIPTVILTFFLFAIVNANANSNSTSNFLHTSVSNTSLPNLVPTSVSKAYTDIPTLNISRSTISRLFYTRMTPGDARPQKVKQKLTLSKPSKLFTNDKDSIGFDQDAFDATTTERVIGGSPTKRATSFSPFLTQTDTGPKIRLEPFFNILTTFQSLALGSSKEQKFSPSYQAVAQGVGVAEAELKARQERNKAKEEKVTGQEVNVKKNKGMKGLRQKKPVQEGFQPSQFQPMHFQPLGKRTKNKGKGKVTVGGGGGGPVLIPLPVRVVDPTSVSETGSGSMSVVPQFEKMPPAKDHDPDDIITAESLDKNQGGESAVNPLDVLSVSMSTSMAMGTEEGQGPGLGQGSNQGLGPTPKSKGTVEDVTIDHIPPIQPESLISIMKPSLGGFTPLIPPQSPLSPRSKSGKKGKKNRKHFSFTQLEPPHQNPDETINVNANVNATDPESRERRLRSETHFFENFHQTESISDLQAEESLPPRNTQIHPNTVNIPSGYALPSPDTSGESPQTQIGYNPQQQLATKYPVSFAFHHPNLPPPGLGVPPKSFFSLGLGQPGQQGQGQPNGYQLTHPKRPTFSPNIPINNDPIYSTNVYGNGQNLQTNHLPHHHYNNLNNNALNNYNKPPEASSDLGEQGNAADSKLEVGDNPHQKIGVMTGFDLFYKQYKVLAWGGFFVVTSLALLCLIVYLYTNSPPTEVVTAKGLLDAWVNAPNPGLMTFLTSIVDENEKGGGNGRWKRKRYKMQKRRRSRDGGSDKDFKKRL